MSIWLLQAFAEKWPENSQLAAIYEKSLFGDINEFIWEYLVNETAIENKANIAWYHYIVL